MKEKSEAAASLVKKIYLFLMFGLTFTGFAQMPIFKRYYIADIPGLGWSAEYYLTHDIHTILAFFLLSLITYQIIWFFALDGKGRILSASGWVRMFLLGGLVITGIFRVLKNMPNIVFPPDFTMAIDILHIVFTMLFGLCALVFFIIKSRWLKPE